MKTPPKADVSILMTVFNTDRYLAEAIDSILHQQTSYRWELIVVDDGSTDGSLHIAHEYAVEHPELIRVLQHDGGENRGISESRNLALSHAGADLIAFLDSDDVWLPHHLQSQVSLLRSLPEVAFVYAAAERWVHFSKAFDEAAARAAWWGENYIPPLLPSGEPAGVLPRGRLLEWFLADESLVPCICTVIVRRAAALAAGGFCNEFRGLYDDQAFHARIILNYDVFASDACVARYRQHTESCCGRSQSNQKSSLLEREKFRSFLATLGDEQAFNGAGLLQVDGESTPR